MASNSIAPSVKALDIYLDGTDWKVDLYAEDGTTQIASTTIGTVDVDADSIVAIPLDIQAMLGAAAHEIRVHGAGVIKVRHADAVKSSFPVAALTVANGEYQDHVHRSRIKLERLSDDSPKTLRSATESEPAPSFA